jgi:lysophospholipase L1-like esterase
MIIEFHGDSTQVGVSVYGGAASPAPVAPWQFVAAQTGMDCRCFARGGETLADALAWLPGHLAKSQAGMIVANWGINDSFTPGLTNAAQAANWHKLAELCAGKKLVIETPNPVSDPVRSEMISGLVQSSRGIQGAAYVEQFDAITRWYPNWKNHMSDGVHPNSIMYLFKGMVLTQGIKPFIGPRKADT